MTPEPGFAANNAPGDAPALHRLPTSLRPTPSLSMTRPTLQEMQGSLRCFCILDPGGRIASVAAAEVDARARFAEMTGFATLPDYRGRGFAGYLLQRMEEDMRSLGVQTTFAVARARSYPANITFARAGYAYAGTLADCTNICGSLEDMNIWCRHSPAGLIRAGGAQTIFFWENYTRFQCISSS